MGRRITVKYVVYFAIGWCLVCGFAGEALAYPGIELLKNCQHYLAKPTTAPGDQHYIEYGMCLGYVSGVHETNEVYEAVAEQQIYCPPKEVEFEQLVRVIVKYLENHPADLHYSAAYNIIFAFKEAFPCPEAE